MDRPFHIPAGLHQVDCLLTCFHLEFREDFHLTAELPMRLRRDLHRASQYAAELQGGDNAGSPLLASPLPADPVALRRFQKPGPPFILHPSPDSSRLYRTGDRWRLPVLFLGRGVQRFHEFFRLLEFLGELGLHKCSGRFEIAAIEGQMPHGDYQPIWQRGEGRQNIELPIGAIGYWLEINAVAAETVELNMLTPARLITGQRPLFRPTFQKVFPFILRRVTSLLYSYANLEIPEVEKMVQESAGITVMRSSLAWQDWRALERETGERVDLGGVVGSMIISGEKLSDLLWVLNLGRICNVGKGAPYGAGHYRLAEA